MKDTPWSPAPEKPLHTSPPRKPRRRRLLGSERAQGLVEFALVLPLFLVLVLATVDFGWALRQYLVMTNSAREGARVGATGANQDAIISKVVNTSSGVLASSNVTEVYNAQGTPGEEVRVTVDKDYSYITPLGGILSGLSGGTLPSPLPMSASATMRLE